MTDIKYKIHFNNKTYRLCRYIQHDFSARHGFMTTGRFLRHEFEGEVIEIPSSVVTKEFKAFLSDNSIQIKKRQSFLQTFRDIWKQK